MLTNQQILKVYKTAESAIRRTCAKYNVRVSEDALADMQQGTLEKMLKSFDASRGAPEAFAWRIAANEATSFLRGRTVSAIKNEDQSLTVENDDGTETVSDLADDSANPFELIAARQLDDELTQRINELSDSGKAGIKAALSDDTMSGADRVAALRAREALSESLRSSHFALIADKKPAKRAKAKREPKVEAEETEAPSLLRLSTVVRIEMELAHLLAARLTVLGPYVAAE